ncbi:hypothetical protein F4775DRAFT_3306 [Biscogniauxia sp. FL1348]|nr:hypothetical protein F4775DRAFT_3306 [Biscogniauxia sp. FL1348]
MVAQISALSTLIRYLHRFLGDKSREEWINGQSMISCLADTFEVDLLDIVRQALCKDILPVLGHLRDIMCDLELSPMTCAILSRSLPDLDALILSDPGATLERMFGLTTLQLSATWPQGLKRLLKTPAKTLIDVGDSHTIRRTKYLQPIQLAVRLNFTKSVDLLLKAGCSFSFDDNTAMLFFWASDECASVIAVNIAERRRKLLQLAQRQVGIFMHKSPFYVADSEAALLCEALDTASIPIPGYLRVPPDYATIYHFRYVYFIHWPVFFENGFQDIHSHNSLGLTAVMVRRELLRQRYCFTPVQKSCIATWMSEHGCFDIKAKDPLGIGLNTTTTGRNHVSSMFGSGHVHFCDTKHAQVGLMCHLMKIMMLADSIDGCVCWCNPKGKGCSGIKSMWKAHVDRGKGGGIMSQEGIADQREQMVRHVLLHATIDPPDLKNNRDLGLWLDLVRFLTFEALEMTHTCCSLRGIDERNRCVASPENYRDDMTLAVVSCDAAKVERIRSDKLEQESARLLDALMDEFRHEMMRRGDSTSTKTLEMFIWGYWRRRISELFAVRPLIVEDMKRNAGHVRTHVLPERVSYFLGTDFDLIKLNANETTTSTDGNLESKGNSVPRMEDAVSLHHCPFCDV